jgi:polysaccharide export outer membrane protein
MGMNLLGFDDTDRRQPVKNTETGDDPHVKLKNLIFAGLLVLPSLCWAQEPAVPATAAAPLGLVPGDEIDVRMYDFPDLGSAGVHAHVSSDGTVHLPYAGTVQVAGLTPDRVETVVGDSLRSKGFVKQPNVTVDIVTAVNFSVYVIGQVVAPKSIPLFSPAPVSFVLGQVGGLNGLAAHHMTIIHPGDEPPTSVELDPDAPTSAGLNALVRPGDVLSVSSRGVYFIVGEVNRPGIFPIGGGINVGQASAVAGLGLVKTPTLLEALAQAGGITNIAARSKMRILRTVDGKREEIIVDEVKLYKGEVADPILHPDDIIYVPSSYLRNQTNNLFSTALSSVYAAATLRAY